MNLRDGIDFYSISRQEYRSTTHYTLCSQEPPRNLVVDIMFVDDDTVLFGHADGRIGFATFGDHRADTFFDIGRRQDPGKTLSPGFRVRRHLLSECSHSSCSGGHIWFG